MTATGDLLAAATQFAYGPAGRPATVTYRVRPGDTLASIASRFYRNPGAWPVIYWRNHTRIKWADDIYAGELLRVPARAGRIPRAPARMAAPAPAPPAGSAPALSTTSSGPYPGGAFGQCVVSRESGGDPQVMSSTGYYGLYQFSASTWAEYGGNPADFGHASVAEQNQVFANALAAGGESNWSLYVGC
jgi:hypothetical protein